MTKTYYYKTASPRLRGAARFVTLVGIGALMMGLGASTGMGSSYHLGVVGTLILHGVAFRGAL